MHEEVIFSGFGGQGALTAGQLLAYTALDAGYEVTWIPSYGPEMRGGTAHCVVIISEEEIGAPIVKRPSSAVVLNLPSMEKYAPLVKPGGVLVVNESLIPARSQRDDIRAIYVPANELAEEMGNIRVANTILLGALVQAIGGVSTEQVLKAIDEHMPKAKELNKQALLRGAAYGQ